MEKLKARQITRLRLCLPYVLEKKKNSKHLPMKRVFPALPLHEGHFRQSFFVIMLCHQKSFAAMKAQHFLASVIGSERGFCGMLGEFIHGSVSSGFLSYYFSRLPIGGANITQIDYDALIS